MQNTCLYKERGSLTALIMYMEDDEFIVIKYMVLVGQSEI